MDTPFSMVVVAKAPKPQKAAMGLCIGRVAPRSAGSKGNLPLATKTETG